MADLDKAMRELLEEGQTPLQTRSALVQRGFLEDEVDKALNDHTSKRTSKTERRSNRLLSTKESFDRLGYGFASPQFINILFWQSGAGLFLIGLFNGLKTVLSLAFSSVLQEYCKHHTVPKQKIANAGLVFGFSFFIMAFAALAKMPWVFAAGFVLGALGVVTYGDLYTTLARAMMKHERRSHFLRKAAFYGALISAVSMLLSGVLIDGVENVPVTLFGAEFAVHGFLISFMITAFSFILGSYILSRISDPREHKTRALLEFLKEHMSTVAKKTRLFAKNPYVLLLLLPATLAGLLQILATSYSGIYIYRLFEDTLFGGYTNVAILYAVALIASLVGPAFTKLVERGTGLAPHLVFGTLLTAILPLVLAKNPHYLAIMAALVCSVIGASVVGTAQGMITQKIMDLKSRKAFFITQAFMIGIPYLLLVPVGAWAAQAYGLETLFLGVGIGLALIVAPLYFVLVIATNKMRL